MAWQKLTPHLKTNEKRLQSLMDSLVTTELTREKPLLFGVPPWLEEALRHKPLTGTQIPRAEEIGYRFRPDLVLRDETSRKTWVIELKYAEKYEPYVVAQALFEAYWLSHEGNGEFKDVVACAIGRYNVANRGAIRHLRDKAGDDPVLQYAEVQICGFAEAEPRILWFEDPLREKWERKQPPDVAQVRYSSFKHWYWMRDTQAWFGFKSQQQERKPLYLIDHWVQVSGDEQAMIGWEGNERSPGNFALWTP